MTLARKLLRGDDALSVSLFTLARSQAKNITWPANIQAGDLAVLLQYATDTYSNAYMSGGTSILFQQDTGGGTTDLTLSASYKICTGSESGAFATVDAGSDGMGKILYIFRGNKPISSIIPSTWTWASSSGVPTTQNVSAFGQSTPLIVLAHCGTQGSSPTSGLASFGSVSPAFDATHGSNSGTTGIGIAGYKIYNSGPANHSIAMTDGGNSNGIMAGYLRLS